LLKNDGVKKINVFYHVYVYKNYELILLDQLDKLIKLKRENSEIDFFVILSPIAGKNSIDDLVYEKILSLTTNITYYKENHYELPTLSLLYNHAKNTINNLYLYVHTKGVTRIDHNDNGSYSYKNVENWRNIMEHFCIENWKYCTEKLGSYDLVGCNYIPHGILGVPAHFSGNFWWSTSEFLKRLDDPKMYITDNIDRFSAEFWIGSKSHIALCLFPIPKPIIEKHNRCFIYTHKEDYENNIIEQEFKNK
jgi:hypothetical protein